MASSYNLPAKLSLVGNVAENWRRFRQSLEIYFEAAGLIEATDSRKIALLLNLIGEEGLNLYNTFDFGNTKAKFQGVIEKFEEHCNPKKNILHARFRFKQRSQKDGELFDSFVTNLKSLAEDCRFIDKEERLRDQLVFGCLDKESQKKLIKAGDPELEEVIQTLRLAEITDKQVTDVQSRGESIDVVNVKPRQFLCKFCGYNHKPGNCPAYSKTCAKCQKKNHFAKMCKTRDCVNEVMINDEQKFCCGSVTYQQLSVESIAWMQVIKLEEVMDVKFKLDPGADVNIICMQLFERLKAVCKHPLNRYSSEATLESWNGFKTPVAGVTWLKISVNDKRSNEKFFIAGGADAVPILSRDTCVKLGLVKRLLVDTLSAGMDKSQVIKDNIDLFEGIGKIKDKLYDIKIKKGTVPVSKPPYRVPLKLQSRLLEELNNLCELEIITKVDEPSEWINRLVIVEKPDGNIRLCLDPKHLNEAIVKEYCNIPTLNELSAKIGNAKIFCVLDLKDSFWHIGLTEQSSAYCTFSTMYGTYKFNRLPFGISVASQVFQNWLSQIFGSIKGVVNYIDDILVYAEDEKEMSENLNKVFELARYYNIRFNVKKFQYMVTQVHYLGHVFEKGTVKPDPEVIRAVVEYRLPKDKTDVQKFLGLVNFLRPFIPNLATITEPLRNLLKKDHVFHWQEAQAKCFESIKVILTKYPVLNNFDPSKVMIIQTDASKTGIGCVLLQDNKPISYASKSLSSAEINYGQIEKEFLAILFSCKKFHTYVYGKKVIVHTDHLPLVSIMRKDVHDIPSTRLQRIKLKLGRYDIDVKYIPGSQMHIADALSRATVGPSYTCDETLNDVVHSINVTDSLKNKIREELSREDCASKLIYYFKNGWPKSLTKVPKEVRRFASNKNALCVEDDLLFIDNRLYVPKTLINYVIEKLHESHCGMSKTKARGKILFYWKNMNSDIEKFVANCHICCKFACNNIKEPMIIRELPNFPFELVSVDIMQYGVDSYFVLIDHYSKWIELRKMSSKTAEVVIKILKQIFSSCGIPKILYCDNVPFNSAVFLAFSTEWQFKAVFSSPHYHQSNGVAERAVGIAKLMLKKCVEGKLEIDYVLLEYRNTPVTGTQYSPSQLLNGRLCRTKLPIRDELLIPSVVTGFQEKLLKNAQQHKNYYDRGSRERGYIFVEGQQIWFKENEHSKEWKPGTILEIDKEHPRSLIIKDEEGRRKRRNASFVKMRLESEEMTPVIDRECYTNIPVQRYWDKSITVPTEDGNQANVRERRAPQYLNDYVTS